MVSATDINISENKNDLVTLYDQRFESMLIVIITCDMDADIIDEVHNISDVLSRFIEKWREKTRANKAKWRENCEYLGFWFFFCLCVLHVTGSQRLTIPVMDS